MSLREKSSEKKSAARLNLSGTLDDLGRALLVEVEPRATVCDALRRMKQAGTRSVLIREGGKAFLYTTWDVQRMIREDCSSATSLAIKFAREVKVLAPETSIVHGIGYHVIEDQRHLVTGVVQGSSGGELKDLHVSTTSDVLGRLVDRDRDSSESRLLEKALLAAIETPRGYELESPVHSGRGFRRAVRRITRLFPFVLAAGRR